MNTSFDWPKLHRSYAKNISEEVQARLGNCTAASSGATVQALL